MSKIIAEAPTRDELARLLAAKMEADATLRPSHWSSRTLLNWLPSVIIVEIVKHLDAKGMAKAAAICRTISDSVDEATASRAAALGLRMPALISGQKATWRLWFTERIGRTGLAWEIKEQAAEEPADDVSPIVLRHVQSGLLFGALILGLLREHEAREADREGDRRLGPM